MKDSRSDIKLHNHSLTIYREQSFRSFTQLRHWSSNNTVWVIFYCSILNSLVIVLFLSGMVAMIMLRTLHKDIARYNQMESAVSALSILYLRYLDFGKKPFLTPNSRSVFRSGVLLNIHSFSHSFSHSLEMVY